MSISQRITDLLALWFDKGTPVGVEWEPDVKAGTVYRVYYLVPIGETLAAGASANLIIKVGSLPIQVFGSYSVGGDCDVITYAGAAYADDGTILTNYGINLTSTHTSDTVVRFNPTINSDGAIIRHQFVPIAKKTGQTFPSDLLTLSTVAPANSVIMARITNSSGAAYRYGFEIFWREYTRE